jgi:hypothetical protein
MESGTADAAARRAEGESGSALRRAIGPKLLTVFIIGDILGAGIYALVGEVGAEVGGAIWTAFMAAFVLALFTAFAYAELVSKYPRAAGAALSPVGRDHVGGREGHQQVERAGDRDPREQGSREHARSPGRTNRISTWSACGPVRERAINPGLPTQEVGRAGWLGQISDCVGYCIAVAWFALMPRTRPARR